MDKHHLFLNVFDKLIEKTQNCLCIPHTHTHSSSANHNRVINNTTFTQSHRPFCQSLK